MANRRYLSTIARHCQSLLSSNASLQSVRTLPRLPTLAAAELLSVGPTSHFRDIRDFGSTVVTQSRFLRHFSSGKRGSGDDEDDVDDDGGEGDEDEDEDEDEEEMREFSDGDNEQDGNAPVSNCAVSRSYSLEEKEVEAALIGYQVIGPLDPLDRPIKPREEAFAVIQIGSHQFKVSNGDTIYTEEAEVLRGQ